MNGIFFVLRTGIPWRDLPERYGPYTTCYNRYNRWSKNGNWLVIHAHLQSLGNEDDDQDEGRFERPADADDRLLSGSRASPRGRIASGRRTLATRTKPGAG